eukprot:6281683-Amphidinium_carterae.1
MYSQGREVDSVVAHRSDNGVCNRHQWTTALFSSMVLRALSLASSNFGCSCPHHCPKSRLPDYAKVIWPSQQARTSGSSASLWYPKEKPVKAQRAYVCGMPPPPGLFGCCRFGVPCSEVEGRQ